MELKWFATNFLKEGLCDLYDVESGKDKVLVTVCERATAMNVSILAT